MYAYHGRKNMEGKNDFLNQLLNLEVSGKDAISAPSNWDNEPLLQIKTAIDDEISEVIPKLLSKNNEKKEGIWWFLVGSPGNGKSAVVGTLYRKLKKDHDAEFIRTDGENSGGDNRSTDIPYCLELNEKDVDRSSAVFAQDASVVPDPFVENPNTGEELIQLLEKAAQNGQSVVVCANRGVIAKALQHKKDNEKRYWRRALDRIDKFKNEEPIVFKEDVYSRNRIFEKVAIKVNILDKNSIIEDKENTFEQLLEKAIHRDEWESDCDTCSSRSLCPFKNNQAWLAEKSSRTRLTDVLRYAELMSGQELVLREALAFISLILAGSSRDYKDKNPCDWVHERVKKGQIFSLLSRRVYMLLFLSGSPHGIETNKDRETTIKKIRKIEEFLKEDGDSFKAIQGLEHEIITDVGLDRFLSKEKGIFPSIDPVKENQGKALEQKWNIAASEISELDDQTLVSELEKKCFAVWEECEAQAEEIIHQDDANYYHRVLRRWITSVSYRLGFFAEGKVLFESELKTYHEALTGPPAGVELHPIKNKIEKDFNSFIYTKNGRTDKINISQNIAITQPNKGKAKLDTANKSRLNMKIGPNSDTPIEISPRCFSWLRRQSDTQLSEKTFPPDVQQIVEDFRKKSVSLCDYHTSDDVKLSIIKPNDEVLELERDGQLLHDA